MSLRQMQMHARLPITEDEPGAPRRSSASTEIRRRHDRPHHAAAGTARRPDPRPRRRCALAPIARPSPSRAPAKTRGTAEQGPGVTRTVPASARTPPPLPAGVRGRLSDTPPECSRVGARRTPALRAWRLAPSRRRAARPSPALDPPLEPGLKPSRAGLGARLEIALCGSRPRTEVAARYGAPHAFFPGMRCNIHTNDRADRLVRSANGRHACSANQAPAPPPGRPGLAPAGPPRPTARRACGRTPARFRRCAGTPADIRQTPVGTCPRTPRT